MLTSLTVWVVRNRPIELVGLACLNRVDSASLSQFSHRVWTHLRRQNKLTEVFCSVATQTPVTSNSNHATPWSITNGPRKNDRNGNRSCRLAHPRRQRMDIYCNSRNRLVPLDQRDPFREPRPRALTEPGTNNLQEIRLAWRPQIHFFFSVCNDETRIRISESGFFGIPL